MNQRFDLRIRADLPVHLSDGRTSFEGRTRDLSFEGAYVCLNRTPLAALRLWLPLRLFFEPDEVDVSVPAVVVRREEQGIGVAFGGYTGTADLYLSDRLSSAFDDSTEPSAESAGIRRRGRP